MGIKKISVVVFISLLFIGCSSSKEAVAVNPALDTLMSEQAFKFEVRTVEPQVTTALMQIANSGIIQPGNTIGNINVDGQGYFLSMDGDQVKAIMPYYGERQMGGGYDSDSGIEFDGLAKDLKIEKDELKQRYRIDFNVDGSSETYMVTIAIAANLKSEVSVRSSHRNRIRYTGAVVELTQEELVAR